MKWIINSVLVVALFKVGSSYGQIKLPLERREIYIIDTIRLEGSLVYYKIGKKSYTFEAVLFIDSTKSVPFKEVSNLICKNEAYLYVDPAFFIGLTYNNCQNINFDISKELNIISVDSTTYRDRFIVNVKDLFLVGLIYVKNGVIGNDGIYINCDGYIPIITYVDFPISATTEER